MENAGPGALTLRLTTGEEVRRLNAQFAGTDRTTDVLAFADGSPDEEGPGVYFGDVVMALPVAEAHAREARHSVQAELELLAVHGTLHLLGHDHATRAGRRAMWKRQEEILASLGCPILSPQDNP